MNIEERIIQLLANLNAIRLEKALDIMALKDIIKAKDEDVASIMGGLQTKGYLTIEGEKVYLTKAGILRAFSYYS
ncbi:MAG: hypothetical protein HXX80_03335 [Nitrososphaerales archaeon]|nr:hypothetical protein [Nitrososphaerales archaeon]